MYLDDERRQTRLKLRTEAFRLSLTNSDSNNGTEQALLHDVPNK